MGGVPIKTYRLSASLGEATGNLCVLHNFTYLSINLHTEAEKMARTWFGEIPYCCSLTVLLGPAWVLLKYVLQTIFSGPVL